MLLSDTWHISGATPHPTVTGGIPEAAQRVAEHAASTDSDSETCLSERTLSTLVAADSGDVDAAAATEEDDYEDALEFDSWRFIKQLPPLSAVRSGAWHLDSSSTMMMQTVHKSWKGIWQCMAGELGLGSLMAMCHSNINLQL